MVNLTLKFLPGIARMIPIGSPQVNDGLNDLNDVLNDGLN
jgi:hypothetical protein